MLLKHLPSDFNLSTIINWLISSKVYKKKFINCERTEPFSPLGIVLDLLVVFYGVVYIISFTNPFSNLCLSDELLLRFFRIVDPFLSVLLQARRLALQCFPQMTIQMTMSYLAIQTLCDTRISGDSVTLDGGVRFIPSICAIRFEVFPSCCQTKINSETLLYTIPARVFYFLNTTFRLLIYLLLTRSPPSMVTFHSASKLCKACVEWWYNFSSHKASAFLLIFQHEFFF